MKVVITIGLIIAGIGIAHAQSVGIGTATPNPTAILHIDAGTSLTNGLLVTGTFNPAATIPDLGGGSRLMFYPGKGAFRAGYVQSVQWNNNNVGIFSVGLGFNTQASGNYSSAFGELTIASGNYSTAMGTETTANGPLSLATGYLTTASGYSSTSMGRGSVASGETSMALGFFTTAKAYGGIAVGLLNNNADAPNGEQPEPIDRIFQIGNGNGGTRSNAFTVLRNGNAGIGVLDPTYRLDLAGRMRIRSGGSVNTSAGIWLNKNDNSGVLGFVGVDGNNDIGIFTSVSGWSFLIDDATGNVKVKGTVTANGVTLTSDERLKKDITPLGELQCLCWKN
jgi:hypothetical protein